MKSILRYRFNRYNCLLATVAIFFPLLAGAGHDCEATSADARKQLEIIHQDLQQVLTLQEYQRSIEKRYDKVETLLANTEQCLKTGHNNELSALKKTLKALRSDARTLAFTKFSNWMQFRKEELALLDGMVATKESVPVSVGEAAEDMKPSLVDEPAPMQVQ